MTKEELMAMGFDSETADQLVKTQGGGSGGGLPYPTLKLNYDAKDILADAGVKKGEIISGWKTDSNTLSVVEEGVILKQPLKFFVVASVFQKSHYNTTTKSTEHITNIYYDAGDSKKQIDQKSKKTVEYVEGVILKDKMKFNNILLLMVIGDDGSLTPYIHYMHGTNYYQFGEQLDENGIDRNSITLQHTFTVKSKKVPTDFNPAWIFSIQKIEPRTMADIGLASKETAEAIKKFNKWIENSNSGSTGISEEEVEASVPADVVAPEEDIDVDFGA
jgi:hypothetical protein